MSWRGSTTVKDRIFACLPYLLPLIEVVAFGEYLLSIFPVLAVVLAPLFVLKEVYDIIDQGLFGFGGLIILFALLMLVVRNERLPHFIRFNTMQAILLDIVIILCSILLTIIRQLGLVPANGLATQTLATTIFLGILAASVYSIVQSLLGRYAEIPAISDAVYMQVR
ncbi:hypothetical protein NIES4071_70040 [Calothrix sp. NIES-4071]|nr:hypothetical protein NIES4071_70040 [Calothrix sp. NIES-4071]BAZ61281.1 hypothetical protein NIES4105_69990 [Calothrix sp. NIES-4105]